MRAIVYWLVTAFCLFTMVWVLPVVLVADWLDQRKDGR